MSYDFVESSNHSAAPAALYSFSIGSTEWLYTNVDEEIVVDGKTYVPLAISDSGQVQSGDIRNDDMTVTIPKSTPLVELFKGTPPSEGVWLTLRRQNQGEPDAPVVWVGWISNVKIVSAGAAEVVCRMLTSTLDRNGLRLSWSRGCPHALYDTGCRVNKDLHATDVEIESLTGTSLASADLEPLADGYLAGGFIEWELFDGVMERRAIESNADGALVLLGTTDGLEAGNIVTVYPGCDRTTSTCETKFNNLLNYGGFPHMPGKSPFDGDPVF